MRREAVHHGFDIRIPQLAEFVGILFPDAAADSQKVIPELFVFQDYNLPFGTAFIRDPDQSPFRQPGVFVHGEFLLLFPGIQGQDF